MNDQDKVHLLMFLSILGEGELAERFGQLVYVLKTGIEIPVTIGKPPRS